MIAECQIHIYKNQFSPNIYCFSIYCFYSYGEWWYSWSHYKLKEYKKVQRPGVSHFTMDNCRRYIHSPAWLCYLWRLHMCRTYNLHSKRYQQMSHVFKTWSILCLCDISKSIIWLCCHMESTLNYSNISTQIKEWNSQSAPKM